MARLDRFLFVQTYTYIQLNVLTLAGNVFPFISDALKINSIL